MRKFYVYLLSAALVLALTGCGSGTQDVTDSTQDMTDTVVTDSAEADEDESADENTEADAAEDADAATEETEPELTGAEAAQAAADELETFKGLEAGLYDLDHNLTASWDQLKSNGTITVEDGCVTAIDQSIQGALVLSDEVTSIADYGMYGCGYSYVILPETLTSIGPSGLGGSGLLAVDIPDSVTDLHGLMDNGSLLWVRLPSGLTEISKMLFAFDYNLVTVIFPDNITTIGDSAFCECYSLENLSIPETVKSIGEGAFENCTFAEFSLPEGIETIGDVAFYDCKGVENVVIPVSLTSGLTVRSFSHCKITNISVAEGNTDFDSREDCNAIIRTKDNEMICCCKNTVVPKSVERMNCSFSAAEGLTSLTIPGKLKVFTSGVLAGSEIKTIYVYDEDTRQLIVDKLDDEDLSDVEVILLEDDNAE